MQAALSIKHLSKSFGPLKILHDISLTVGHHEFVSIIGPSGSGKSTLFHILAGVEESFSGEILYEQDALKVRSGKFGYMPQDVSLFPWKTVLENIMLGPVISGTAKKTAQKKAYYMLKKFNLQDFSDNYPSTLSGGMKQRVALLRTVLFNPNFLLLDEPFGSLDALTRHEAQMWLLDVWNSYHSSVLFITHDIQETILLSDRIYVFSNRPAAIIKEIKVDLPRPRKLIDLTNPKAIALEKKLLALLTKA
jgi:NitT/TauT family transport system ATP-binding protein